MADITTYNNNFRIVADQILLQEFMTNISYLLDDYLKTQNRHLDPSVSETSLSAVLHSQTPDWQNASREFGDLAKRGRHHWEETIPIHVASPRFLFAGPQAHHIPRIKYIIHCQNRSVVIICHKAKMYGVETVGRNEAYAWYTLHNVCRSLCLLLTRNSAVMSLGGFTSEASFHCLFISSIFSFNASIFGKRKQNKRSTHLIII